MPISRFRLVFVGAAANAFALSGCGADSGWEQELAHTSANLSGSTRLAACAQDPRVVAKLVSKEICAGADIFFREEFDGNGRTCGSCHPVENNMTVDRTFINDLHQTNPDDPLFIFQNDPDLAQLEINQLFNGGILENVDDFSDPTHKFVHRSVPHVLSMATSLAPDDTDGTTNPPRQRTGWSGDGAPGNGTLREFLTGASRSITRRRSLASRASISEIPRARSSTSRSSSR